MQQAGITINFFQSSPSRKQGHSYDGIEPTQTIPEHGLLQAMIERAIMDVAHPAKNKSIQQAYTRQAKRQQRDALEWIFDYPNSTERWSFEWVCEHLDLQPNHMRAAIKALVENNIKLAFRNRQCAAPMYKAA